VILPAGQRKIAGQIALLLDTAGACASQGMEMETQYDQPACLSSFFFSAVAIAISSILMQ
jgi:hypothetical protein